MDMDYIKNLVPYDNEVADPIIDQLVVDLEWVTAIKKTLGVVRLQINDEVEFADNDPLGGNILGSLLVGGVSDKDIGRAGPCRMCDAQPSDTDVRKELKFMNDKLDKVLNILAKMPNQNESSSKLCGSLWYRVTRLQRRLRKGIFLKAR